MVRLRHATQKTWLDRSTPLWLKISSLLGDVVKSICPICVIYCELHVRRSLVCPPQEERYCHVFYAVLTSILRYGLHDGLYL